MFKETRKMMELFEEVGCRKVLVVGIDMCQGDGDFVTFLISQHNA